MWLLIDFFLAFSQLLFWFLMKTAFFTTAPSNCNELWDWLNTDDEICIEFLKFLLYLYLLAYGQNRLIFSFWFKFELPTIHLKLWVGQWIKQPKNHRGGYLIASLKSMNFSCIVWTGIYRYLHPMSCTVPTFGAWLALW